MWQDKAIARLGHACGCSLRTILGYQLARIFLADGHFVWFYPLIHTASVCHQNVTRHFRFFCLSSCSCNIHQIQLKYLLASTEESVKHHLYTPNRYNINLGVQGDVAVIFSGLQLQKCFSFHRMLQLWLTQALRKQHSPSSVQLYFAEMSIDFRQLRKNTSCPWYWYCCWSEEPIV